MALLRIRKFPDPALKQAAKPVENINGQLAGFIDSMVQTMYAAPGVGLAAPQLGLALQLAVIEDREEYHKEVSPALLKERERSPVPFHVLINPVIEEMGDGRAEFFEGCLSLPGLVKAISLPERQLCNACFHGRYPMAIDGATEKLSLEQARP